MKEPGKHTSSTEIKIDSRGLHVAVTVFHSIAQHDLICLFSKPPLL